jgi:cytosine/adenosine deaminase-related metal-dependent hydrolase
MSFFRTSVLTADVVYNGIGTARSKGAVVVQHVQDRALVTAVTSQEEARRLHPDAEVTDAGFALSPAPVNAHTHLDLSSMPLTPGAYERFIPSVIGFTQAGRRTLAAARTGAAEILAGGVSVIGDIVTNADVMRYLLASEQLSGVAYWEVISPDPAAAPAQLAEVEVLLQEFLKLQRPGGVRVGLTPHTPHTVSGAALQGLARLARQFNLPLQIHVAESPLENAMQIHGSGELADVRRRDDPGWEPPGLSPVKYLESLGVLEARPTLVHMVNVDEDDVRAVQRAGCAVVHCPRSNGILECGVFPWELYARHGVAVAFGTDSRASSPSLSVVEEVRHAAGLHGAKASPLALVRAAVKGGYQALGLQPPRFGPGSDLSKVFQWDGNAAVVR